jgi:hypothetical protein
MFDRPREALLAFTGLGTAAMASSPHSVLENEDGGALGMPSSGILGLGRLGLGFGMQGARTGDLRNALFWLGAVIILLLFGEPKLRWMMWMRANRGSSGLDEPLRIVVPVSPY